MQVMNLKNCFFFLLYTIYLVRTLLSFYSELCVNTIIITYYHSYLYNNILVCQ